MNYFSISFQTEPQKNVFFLNRNNIFKYKIPPLCPHDAGMCGVIACKRGKFTRMAFVCDVVTFVDYKGIQNYQGMHYYNGI